MFQFNNSALQLPSVSSLGDYTIACRFAATTGTLDTGRTVYCSDDNAGPGLRAIAVYQACDEANVAASCFARVNDTGVAQSPAKPSEDLLHTLVIRRTGTIVTFWLDGVRIATTTVASATLTLPTPTIGAYFITGSGYFDFFDGLIDRFSVWSRAWTVQEIGAFHTSPDVTAFADQSGLVYDLPLDTDTVERHSGATVTQQGTPTHFTGTIPANATPPTPPAPVARIRAGWPKISPDRGLISFLIESIADSTNAPIAIEFGGATLTADGGAPVALTDPFYSASTKGNLISYPIKLSPQVVIVDDHDAAVTSTGTLWAEFGDSGLYGAKVWLSNDPAATRTYPVANLTPGTWSLAVIPASNSAPPSGTTDASYSVNDGVLAPQVLHQDQTAPNLPIENFMDMGVYWQTLGTVTISGTTANVTLANAAGANYLFADAIRLEKVFPDVIPGNATSIVLDAPDGWATVGAGDVAGATARAVSVVATMEEWAGYDANATHPAGTPMRIGRNHNGVEPYAGSRLRANLLLQGDGPIGIGGDLDIDLDGNVTGMGTATGIKWQVVHNDGMKDGGITKRMINFLRPGSWKVRYNGTASTPTPVMVDVQGRSFFSWSHGATTVDPGSGKTVHEFIVSLPDYVELYPASVELQFQGIPTNADRPTGVELFDPDTPSDWSKSVHPLLYNREHGPTTGIDTWRLLDPMMGKYGGVVSYSDMKRPGSVRFMLPDRTPTATVASIDPVDVTVADADHALTLYPNTNNLCVIKVTTTAPHPFATGNYIDFHLTNNDPTDSSGHTTHTTFGDIDGYKGIVETTTDPNVFLAACFTEGLASENTNAAGPITLTAPFAFGSGTVTAVFGKESVSPEVLVKLCNEVDVIPYLVIPHTMSDQGIDDLADAVLAVLDPGRKIRLEYSNEAWNFTAGTNIWFRIMGFRAPNRVFMKEYAHRAINAHNRFRARWTAAGRDPADVIRVMGSQAAAANYTQDILDQCASEVPPATFDELAIDTYVISNAPMNIDPAYAGDPTAAFERLDEAGLLSLQAVNQRYTDWAGLIDPHLQKLTGAFSGVKLISYEGGYQQLCPYASDGTRLIQKSLSATRHPYMLPLYKARLQMLEAGSTGAGAFSLYCHYIDEGARGLNTGAGWVARPAYFMDDGKGDGSDGKFDNRTGYFAYDKIVSVQGQAEKEYAALSLGGVPAAVSRFAHRMFMHFINVMRS